MNNKKVKLQIDRTVEQAIQYWERLSEKYCAEYGFGPPGILFYNTSFDTPYGDEIVNAVRYNVDAMMATVIVACNDAVDYDTTDIPVDERIVGNIWAATYMSYENLYGLILECEMDFDRVNRCLKFIMRHEMGHIIDKHLNFVGKTAGEWNLGYAKVSEEEASMPKLRKNASYASRLKWLRRYFQLPAEKLANELAGITDDDIVEYWRLTMDTATGRRR